MKVLSAILLSILISACSSTPSQTSQSDTDAPEIVQYINQSIHGYRYQDYKKFDNNLGYALRYVKEDEPTIVASVFVWPTPESTKSYSHKEIIYAVTKASLDDIYVVEKLGDYQNVNVLEAVAYDNDVIVTKHKLSLTYQDIPRITLLYVSEHQGDLLKVRLTMDNNPKNIARQDIDQFVMAVFSEIVKAKAKL